ncbi:hypothetical protein SAMN06272735_0566 [Streptomyces sp. TLI_55]|uniref:hypothetical protein n=1 Tax=Streptomyces sp. TLI_55 TaxID=1938861 RepID=UPI000BC5F873|nr:hypothetical protein [Streptomyces sp. TLI_55]SNX56122.1 hypothetical protein SAMN06272735_0566 [Streptomyces sp. TLI_55]
MGRRLTDPRGGRSSNALRLESYIQDAERDKDTEVADLFREARADSRKGAEIGKGLLRARLNGG